MENSVRPHTISMASQFTCANKRSGFYANPNDCSGYYICAGGYAFQVKCAVGLNFNAKTSYCDWPRNSHCSLPNSGTQTPQLTTRGPVYFTNAPNFHVTHAPRTTVQTLPPWMFTNKPTTQQQFTQQPFTQQPMTQRPMTFAPIGSTASANIAPSNNHFCKTLGDGLYRDPKNCGYYYQCAFGLTFWEPCPPKLAFNDAKKTCDWAINVPACQNIG